MKIILWGVGNQGRKFFQMRVEFPFIFDDDVIAVVDRNPDLWGKYWINEVKITDEGVIKDNKWDKIVILSSNYENEIREYIRIKYDFNASYVYNFDQYVEEKIIYYQYEANARKMEAAIQKESYSPFYLNSYIVYTAIIGDYDRLNDPLEIDPNARYICFTDQEHIKSNVWEIRHVSPRHDISNALLTRYYKFLPHRLFPEYATSIWVDAAFIIKKKLSELLKLYQIKSDFLLIPHPWRICIYDEVAFYMLNAMDCKEDFARQIKKYLNDSYPLNNGLFCGGFLARNHMNNKLIKIMEEWYCEVENFSGNDQVSLPYVLWKNHFHCDLAPIFIRESPWLKHTAHKIWKVH